jgi:hypothetical protein
MRVNQQYYAARRAQRERVKAERMQQVRVDRAAKKAGVLGLTRFEVIMRDQLAARVAADTAAALAEHQRSLESDAPPPTDPFGGFFSDILKDMKP